MLFNSPAFLFGFLPLTALLCFLVRSWAGREASLAFLVLASLFFYGWWNPVYLPLLIGLAVFNFLLARAIMGERARPDGGASRLLLVFGVTVDLGALGYFKYTDFLIGTVNSLTDAQLPLQHIVLPLAISFFTFQKIAYLVDASRGRVEPHSFLEYCFFVMFFPQLIAGPIVHHHEIFSQTKRARGFAFDRMNMAIGLTIFFAGLFKKVVLADNLAPVASASFAAAASGHEVGFLQAGKACSPIPSSSISISPAIRTWRSAPRASSHKIALNFHSPYQA